MGSSLCLFVQTHHGNENLKRPESATARPEAAKTFYRDALGLPLVRDSAFAAWVSPWLAGC